MTVQTARPGVARRGKEEASPYDALLVLSFGGPEGPGDVRPFLENVTRGRNIPRERLEEVAQHYDHFGGVSPINAQNRALIAALEQELTEQGIDLPIYFANRNWHPFLADTLVQMAADGVRNALVFVTSAFSSYSGCRQYREDLIRAAQVAGTAEMRFAKIRVFYNHPGFVGPLGTRLREVLARFAPERRPDVAVVFTAHSIPLSMAQECSYERQIREACRLVATLAVVPQFRLAWQSRSGPPQVPWLAPDILSELEALRAGGTQDVIVVPIGFLSDHLEVLYDLDLEAQACARQLGMMMVRLPTISTDPVFVAMIRELIQERMTARPERRFLGSLGPSHDTCPAQCCLPRHSERHLGLEGHHESKSCRVTRSS